jgi:hypothetical protein
MSHHSYRSWNKVHHVINEKTKQAGQLPRSTFRQYDMERGPIPFVLDSIAALSSTRVDKAARGTRSAAFRSYLPGFIDSDFQVSCRFILQHILFGRASTEEK